MFQDVVFLQGDEAHEAMDILDENGEAALLEHLKQWDMGDRNLTRAELPHGSEDHVYRAGDYVMAYNAPLGYCGLVRKLAE